MNLCLDCKFLERGYSLEDHICTRPTGARRLAARERFSASLNACGHLGRFWLPAEGRAIGRKEWGEGI